MKVLIIRAMPVKSENSIMKATLLVKLVQILEDISQQQKEALVHFAKPGV